MLDRLGVPMVLAFLWVDTQYLSEKITQAVRDRYPDASQVLVANIASLRGIPGIFHGLAESEMKKAYKETVEKLSGDVDPGDYVIILPDWKSACARALSLRDISSKPAVAVLDGEGGIVGVYQGEPETLAKAALELLDQVILA